MFFVFAGILKVIAPGWGFSTFYSVPMGWVSHFLCARGVGEFALSKNSLGGWSNLELTDTRDRANFCICSTFTNKYFHKQP